MHDANRPADGRPAGASAASGAVTPSATDLVAEGVRVRWRTVGEVDPAAADLLDAGERARWEAARTPSQRARFLGAAVLMRELLAEVAGCAAQEVGLDRTCRCGQPHGRPVPTGAASGWHVSASHSGPFVLVGVAPRPLGVDVELVAGALPSAAVLRRVLAPGETEPGDPAAFTALWCVKEAHLKALETGLDIPARTIRVERDSVVPVLPDGPPGGRWFPLQPPVPVPAARAAICLPEEVPGH